MHFSTLAIFAAALCGVAFAAPRTLAARDCSAEAAALNMARRAKRGLPPRSIYPAMPNEICVLAPEIAKENYVLAGSVVRNDVVDGEPGVPFFMDVGVLDITTCQPLPNVMVEMWSTNATGHYSPTALRGAYATAANGIAEIQTIFPGWSDGANHIDLAVHSSDSMNSATSHNGRVFFTDGWTNIIGMSSPYNQNTNARVLDEDDPVYAEANSNGYWAIVDVEEIYDDWPEGIVGYITVGINPTLVVD